MKLSEQLATRGISLPTQYGARSLDLRVQWWVHDPVQVVLTRTRSGWDAVRRDLDQRLRELKGEVKPDLNSGLKETAAPAPNAWTPPTLHAHLGDACRLDAVGLTYRVTDVASRELHGDLRLGHHQEELPFSWAANSQAEYDFCLQAVRTGPVALAALWLLRHPDQVNQVLDWTARNPSALQAETRWQDEIAALLGRLSEQEQRELSTLLRDRLAAAGRHVPRPTAFAGPPSAPHFPPPRPGSNGVRAAGG
ncbi:hypothetical protein JJV70_20210 [Streptomyces sp. JJ66]|uniref:hypothetical protein n=1 Tax=Streptomyces sp. JJ66 TaxID=2803843 RepID=UPI001C58352F|nr:hypothetical protein [Streptomyces sp. JJ66]MBW1604383.1 hypothetical protein [Streptomyces sp. JJ66]